MKKFIIVLAFFVFVFGGCQSSSTTKTTMKKETSRVSITVKNPNDISDSQQTQ